MKNIEIGGIWNIRGIFLKIGKTIKISKILEYGIFHRIFLEYSKNCKTSHGGVKFNQVFKCINKQDALILNLAPKVVPAH